MEITSLDKSLSRAVATTCHRLSDELVVLTEDPCQTAEQWEQIWDIAQRLERASGSLRGLAYRKMEGELI